MRKLILIMAATLLYLAPMPSIVRAQDDDSAQQGGSDVQDFNVFYDELSQYGDWVTDSQYGSVWVPKDVPSDWRPYTVGHWAYTDDYGWTWVSDEPFGWAVFHYGRWFYSDDLGWAWVPGTHWGPAWVTWRQGDGYIGWTPLPPDVRWQDQGGFSVSPMVVEREISPARWSFIPEADFGEPTVVEERIIEPSRNVIVINRTTNVTNYRFVNNNIVNVSINVVNFERDTHRHIQHYRIRDIHRDRDHRTVVRGDVHEIDFYRPRVVHHENVKIVPRRVVNRDVVVKQRHERRPRGEVRTREVQQGGHGAVTTQPGHRPGAVSPAEARREREARQHREEQRQPERNVHVQPGRNRENVPAPAREQGNVRAPRVQERPVPNAQAERIRRGGRPPEAQPRPEVQNHGRTRQNRPSETQNQQARNAGRNAHAPERPAPKTVEHKAPPREEARPAHAAPRGKDVQDKGKGKGHDKNDKNKDDDR